MKTTYTAGKDLIEINGEIYFLSDKEPIDKQYFIFFGSNSTEIYRYHSDAGYGVRTYSENESLIVSRSCCSFSITHSTASLDGVIKLDRQKFVKPVNVEELAKEYAIKQGENARNYAVAADWIAGYNAKEGVYTREQLILAIRLSRTLSKRNEHTYSVDEILNKVDYLNLPSSVTLTDNEITEILW